MKTVQNLVFSLYLLLSILLSILDHLYPGQYIVRCCKFSIIASIFLLALIIRKRFPEQALMTLSLFFITLGDSIFVLSNTLRHYDRFAAPLGGFSFLVAYIILIALFQKGSRINFRQAPGLIPVLAVYIPVFLLCYPYVVGFKFLVVFTFSLFLCYMAWRAICTTIERYYMARISYYMAAAGYLILISDLAVGLAVFYPPFSGRFLAWLESIIWVSFIMAWTFIFLIISEKNSFYSGGSASA